MVRGPLGAEEPRVGRFCLSSLPQPGRVPSVVSPSSVSLDDLPRCVYPQATHTLPGQATGPSSRLPAERGAWPEGHPCRCVRALPAPTPHCRCRRCGVGLSPGVSLYYVCMRAYCEPLARRHRDCWGARRIAPGFLPPCVQWFGLSQTPFSPNPLPLSPPPSSPGASP